MPTEIPQYIQFESVDTGQVENDNPDGFDADKPPIEDPKKMLAWLKWYNRKCYDYPESITPEMLLKAIAWAQANNFDVQDLTEAHIILSQGWSPDNKTLIEQAAEEIEKRIDNLRKNIPELISVLLPAENMWFHATPQAEAVSKIQKEGLQCNTVTGLSGIAESLTKKNERQTDEEVIDANIKALASPHRGYRYLIILRLPELTEKQQREYRDKRLQGEITSSTALFVTPRPQADVLKEHGAGISYNAIIDPEYITGYIDLDTGKYVAK